MVLPERQVVNLLICQAQVRVSSLLDGAKTITIGVLEDAGKATARRIFCADFTNALFP